MTDHARIRINLSQREVEVEGSPAFVERYAEQMETLLQQLASDTNAEPSMPLEADPPASPPVDLGTFGEYLHRLPSSATEVDKILAAGYFCEASSGTGGFTTADANRRLVEHGVKVGNASQCVKQSVTARRVFKLDKTQYKVSQEGHRYLDRLLSA